MASFNHTPAEMIAAILLEQGIGINHSSTGDWRIFVHSMPDDPNNTICVYNSIPALDGRYHRTGEEVKHHGIQVVIRAMSNRQAWLKGQAIETVMEQIFRRTLNLDSNVYVIQGATLTAGLTFVRQEEKNRRQLFSINWILTIN